MTTTTAPVHGPGRKRRPAASVWPGARPRLQGHRRGHRRCVRLLHGRSRPARRAPAARPPQAGGDDPCPERALQGQDRRGDLRTRSTRLRVPAVQSSTRLPEPDRRARRDHRGVHPGRRAPLLRRAGTPPNPQRHTRPSRRRSHLRKARHVAARAATQRRLTPLAPKRRGSNYPPKQASRRARRDAPTNDDRTARSATARPRPLLRWPSSKRIESSLAVATVVGNVRTSPRVQSQSQIGPRYQSCEQLSSHRPIDAPGF